MGDMADAQINDGLMPWQGDPEQCSHGMPDDRLCDQCGRNPKCRWNEDGDCRCILEPHDA